MFFNPIPKLTADRDGFNCKVKGLRLFYFWFDKADQIAMLNSWIRQLEEAKAKLSEVKPKKPELGEIVPVVNPKLEAKRTVPDWVRFKRNNPPNPFYSRTKWKKVKSHLLKHGQISIEEADTYYNVKNLCGVISTLKSKGMKIKTIRHDSEKNISRHYVLEGGENVTNRLF